MKRNGISLLEVLVSIFILSIGLLSVALLLVPGQYNLREAGKADYAVECGQAGLADAAIRGVLNPDSWRNTDGTEIGMPKPVPLGTLYPDTTKSYPWGESYVIDPLYVATRKDAQNRDAEPSVAPEQYAAFPYRPEQPGVPVFGETWTRLRRVTSTVGGGFVLPLAESVFAWQGETVFARETDDSRPEQLFHRVGTQLLAPKMAGKYTWLVTITPTPEPISFIADTTDGLAAFGRYEQLFQTAVVVFHRRDLSPPGGYVAGEPPPERQVKLEFLGDGYGGGDVRLRVFGDPADISTWQPTEYLADVRENEWILVTGRRVVSKHYEQADSAMLVWPQTIGVHYWYRVVNVTEITEDGSPPWMEATLAGPDWHSAWCLDMDGDGLETEAIASLFDGIIGVFTSIRRLR